MGLDIRSSLKSGKFGSYHRLHILRQWVYEFVEGNSREDIEKFYSLPTEKYKTIVLKDSRCNALLNHSDCDGGYIDYEYFGIISINTDDSARLGDLRELAKELIMLREMFYHLMPCEVRNAFDDLCSYIFYDSYMDITEIVNVLEFL